MHRIVIACWVAGAAGVWWSGDVRAAALVLIGAAGAWSLSLVQRWFGERDG